MLFRSLGEQLQKEKQDCEAMVRQDAQVVEQFFQGLELILAQKREAFLGALDSASLEISLTFDPLIHRLKEMQVHAASRGQANWLLDGYSSVAGHDAPPL